jgi:hypothetical protein
VLVTAAGEMARDSDSNTGVTLPVTAGVTASPAWSITLDCSDDVSAAAAADEVDMTATPVSSLAG